MDKEDKILLTNLNLFNPCVEPAFIENANIVVSGEQVESVGVERLLGDFNQVIDFKGKYALPGMINAHHHLYSALAVGMPPPRKTPHNFTDILREVWWKLDLALDKDSTRASFESGLLDSLKAGTTTVIDHHCSPSYIEGSLSLLAETGEALGLNTSVAFEVSDRNGSEKFESSLRENLEAAEKYSDHPYVSPLIGLHASFTLSDASLKQVHDAATKIEKWGVHVHLSEDLADERDAAERGFGSTVERLDHFGLINARSLLIHGVHTKDSDIELIRKRQAALIHNPTSNANNRVGMLSGNRIDKLRGGLGTDGMQSNMLREAKEGMLVRSSHLSGGEPATDYMKLLFDHNPRIATGLFGRKIGHVLPGYQADLAVYDYHPRTAVTPDNVFGHVFFGLDSLPCEVITRGRFRIRERRVLEVSEPEIKATAAGLSKQLWNQLG